MFLAKKKFLLPGDMIVPQCKRGFSHSPKQLKFLVFMDMIIPEPT
jgi:hypothetical protein